MKGAGKYREAFIWRVRPTTIVSDGANDVAITSDWTNNGTLYGAFASTIGNVSDVFNSQQGEQSATIIFRQLHSTLTSKDRLQHVSGDWKITGVRLDYASYETVVEVTKYEANLLEDN